MPGSPSRRPRGLHPADLAILLACVLAVALTDPPPTAGSPPSSATPAARTPAAQPDARRLAAPAVLLDADGVQRRVDDGVALTFDDGPDPRWTPVVLDLLRQHHARATFCVVGQHVAEHPELVRRIAAEGHVLCNHTWTHDEAMELRPPAAVRDEIGRTSKVIARAAGVRPRYYRAPAGRWGPRAGAEADRLGMGLLGWSVDPTDWRHPAATEITRRVLAFAAPGAIVLLHDGYGERGNTVAAVRVLLRALAARGLAFTTP